MRRFKVVLLWLALMMTAAGALGCNTVEGVGKDIKGAGEAIEEAAD